jgi:hypothetical protein
MLAPSNWKAVAVFHATLTVIAIGLWPLSRTAKRPGRRLLTYCAIARDRAPQRIS